MAARAGLEWDERVNRLPVIAVLDDEPQLRKALRRLLVAHGFAVVTFEHGEDVVAALTAQPMDCLLLDLHMEGTNGFDVLEKLAERHLTTPAIVITGHGEPGTIDRVLAMGAAACLNKPVDESSLLAAIGEATASRATPWNSAP
jgi:FixJ family two-component response regulator